MKKSFSKPLMLGIFVAFPSPGADTANPFLKGVRTPLSSGVHLAPSSTSLFPAPLFLHPGLNPYGIDKEKITALALHTAAPECLLQLITTGQRMFQSDYLLGSGSKPGI